MRFPFMPKSRSGTWAVGFGVSLVVVTVIELLFAIAIVGDSAVIEKNAFLSTLAAVLSILFTLAGPLSFVFGLYSGIRHKEWSVFKPLGLLYALTLILFLLGEFSFPH